MAENMLVIVHYLDSINCNVNTGGIFCGSITYYEVGSVLKTGTSYEALVNTGFLSSNIPNILNNWTSLNLGHEIPSQASFGEGMIIRNLPIQPKEVNMTSYEYILVSDPMGNSHFFKNSDMQTSLKYWEDNKPFKWIPLSEYTWEDVWNFLRDKGALPHDSVFDPQYVSGNILQNNEYLLLYFPMPISSSDITIYIPQQVADTRTVSLQEDNSSLIFSIAIGVIILIVYILFRIKYNQKKQP